jgi:hypothetical protein
MRIGDGSIPVIFADWMMLRMDEEGVSVEDLLGGGSNGLS